MLLLSADVVVVDNDGRATTRLAVRGVPNFVPAILRDDCCECVAPRRAAPVPVTNPHWRPRSSLGNAAVVVGAAVVGAADAGPGLPEGTIPSWLWL